MISRDKYLEPNLLNTSRLIMHTLSQSIPWLKPVSLFHQVGGDEFLERVVDRFYLRAIDDDLLRPFFVKTRTVRLKKHLLGFFARTLQGKLPPSANISSVQIDHFVEVSRVHIDRVVYHLAEIMETEDLPGCLVAQALMEVAPVAGEVLFTTLLNKAEPCQGLIW